MDAWLAISHTLLTVPFVLYIICFQFIPTNGTSAVLYQPVHDAGVMENVSTG